MDSLVPLQRAIQQSFRFRQLVLAVFYDLSGAFDRASQQGVLFKVASLVVSVRLLRWLSSFLADRSFTVSSSSALPNFHLVTSGVHQGPIISTLLLIVLLSDLPSSRGVATSI